MVHFCDHDSYLSYFAYRYGSVAIRTPFEKYSNTEHWEEVCEQKGLNLSEVKKNPLLLVKQRDVMRTRYVNNILFMFYSIRCQKMLKIKKPMLETLF